MAATDAGSRVSQYWYDGAYGQWLKQQDVPIHGGYYVEDFRTLERGYWKQRGCPGAILNLKGHEGVTEARILEVPPGQTIPPFRMALEESVYVAEGTGICTVWAEGHEKISFEFQKHSLFKIPTNYWYQLSNSRGDQSVLTLHMSYLPLALTTNSNLDYFFSNPFVDTSELYETDGNFFSQARSVKQELARGEGAATGSVSDQWFGNFFPDLTLWDNLYADTSAGRLSWKGRINFPNSAIRVGMMILPSRRYRTAHRHGAGVTIIGVQKAEGFVIMWPEGASKEEHVIATWKEGSVFVPPNGWYHMHVNSGDVENRQLRIFPPRPIMNYTLPDKNKFIPFVKEEPWIREYFEAELAKRGLTSLMPPECYADPNYQWDTDWLNED
jgi:hypothetical protein